MEKSEEIQFILEEEDTSNKQRGRKSVAGMEFIEEKSVQQAEGINNNKIKQVDVASEKNMADIEGIIAKIYHRNLIFKLHHQSNIFNHNFACTFV